MCKLIYMKVRRNKEWLRVMAPYIVSVHYFRTLFLYISYFCTSVQFQYYMTTIFSGGLGVVISESFQPYPHITLLSRHWVPLNGNRKYDMFLSQKFNQGRWIRFQTKLCYKVAHFQINGFDHIRLIRSHNHIWGTCRIRLEVRRKMK